VDYPDSNDAYWTRTVPVHPMDAGTVERSKV
jgi:hypothetical protein